MQSNRDFNNAKERKPQSRKRKYSQTSITLFHATASENVESILTNGLLASQRGKNIYGLDYDVDYKDVYGSSEAGAAMQKPPCVHLAKNYETVFFYSQLLEETLGVKSVILKVKLDTLKFDLQTDPEDRRAYICKQDIPESCVAIYKKTHSPRLFEEKKAKTKVKTIAAASDTRDVSCSTNTP